MTAHHEQSVRKAQFEQRLQTARGRVHRAVLWANLQGGLDRGLRVVVWLSTAYVLLRVVCLLAGRSAPLGWTPYGALAVLSLLVSGVAALLGGRRPPTFAEAAERLDLGVNDHNRIATALCLLERGDAGEFAQAAVEDGVAFLVHYEEAIPRVLATESDWRRRLSYAAIFIVLTAAAGLIRDGQAPRNRLPGQAMAAVLPTADKPAGPVAEKSREPEKPPVTPSTVTKLDLRRKVEAAAGSTPGSRNQEKSSAGQAGGGASAKASPSDQSASANGEATSASAQSQSEGRKPARKAAQKKAKETNVGESVKKDDPTEASSISQGSAGGGSMSPVQNAWSLRERAADGDREEDESDQLVEDQNESNHQRGGVQPLLKDRNESPSRDLGISGDEGPPGTGRGGPSPQKKSRGTASLVLGVPVPDFVKGRVGPGTTKVNHERVQPVPMPGDPAAPVAVGPRSVEENPCPRFEVPAWLAATVRDYLVNLHSADQNANRSSPENSRSK